MKNKIEYLYRIYKRIMGKLIVRLPILPRREVEILFRFKRKYSNLYRRIIESIDDDEIECLIPTKNDEIKLIAVFSNTK